MTAPVFLPSYTTSLVVIPVPGSSQHTPWWGNPMFQPYTMLRPSVPAAMINHAEKETWCCVPAIQQYTETQDPMLQLSSYYTAGSSQHSCSSHHHAAEYWELVLHTTLKDPVVQPMTMAFPPVVSSLLVLLVLAHFLSILLVVCVVHHQHSSIMINPSWIIMDTDDQLSTHAAYQYQESTPKNLQLSLTAWLR